MFNSDYYTVTTHKKRSRVHLYMQLIASVCAAIGFIAIYVNTNSMGEKHHFNTYHGIFGLIVMIMIGINGIGGASVYYASRIGFLARSDIFKTLHSIGGVLIFILGNLSVILGFYSKWYEKKGFPQLRFFIIPLMCLSTILVLKKCLLTLKDRLWEMCRQNL